MEFGKTLREAREAKGYSIAQLAEQTHIMSQIIEGMEREDFKKIVAPIYGRGFVKLLCQQLDLDQKAMIDEFMAIYTGEKPPATSAEPLAPPPVEKPEEPAAVQPEPAIDIPPPVQRDLFSEPTAPTPPPASRFSTAAPTPPPASRFAPASSSGRALSRFAPPTPISEGGNLANLLANLGQKIPWRLVGLIAAAIAILWILGAGLHSLYSYLSDPLTETSVPETVSSAPSPSGATSGPSGSAAKTPRSPKPVKPLYID